MEFERADIRGASVSGMSRRGRVRLARMGQAGSGLQDYRRDYRVEDGSESNESQTPGSFFISSGVSGAMQAVRCEAMV